MKKRGRKPMGNVAERRCTICKTLKPADAFFKAPSVSGGITYTCKDCNKRRAVYNTMKRQAHAEGKHVLVKQITRLQQLIDMKKKILKEME
jgi:hypothetical protein